MLIGYPPVAAGENITTLENHYVINHYESSFHGSLWALICLVGGGVFGSIASEAGGMRRRRRS